jgi:hypothetical protein
VFLHEKLCTGGEQQLWGWSHDPFGVSWQFGRPLPSQLPDDMDAEKPNRVLQAMPGMKKIIIVDLQQAYERKKGCGYPEILDAPLTSLSLSLSLLI